MDVLVFVRSNAQMEILSAVLVVLRSAGSDVGGGVLASFSMPAVAGRYAVTENWVDTRNVTMAMIWAEMGAPQIVRQSPVLYALLLLFLRTLVEFTWIHVNQYVGTASVWVPKIATTVIIWISTVVHRYARLNAVSRASVRATLQRDISAVQLVGMEWGGVKSSAMMEMQFLSMGAVPFAQLKRDLVVKGLWGTWSVMALGMLASRHVVWEPGQVARPKNVMMAICAMAMAAVSYAGSNVDGSVLVVLQPQLMSAWRLIVVTRSWVEMRNAMTATQWTVTDAMHSVRSK
jgi:hypothetical protein